MSDTLQVFLLEIDPKWEDSTQNIQDISTLFARFSPKDALVVLPEMFATGFSMNTQKIGQSEKGEILTWMKQQSKQNQCCICGSIAIEENGKFFNRLYAVSNGEILVQYNKRHLFSYGNEDQYYTSGSNRESFEYQSWHIFPTICYDVRFPVWNANNLGFDLLLNVANWPKQRKKAWDTLLKARAIENQCFVAAVNRIGVDGNNLEYEPSTYMINYEGDIMNPNCITKNIFQFTLSKSELLSFREKYTFLPDSDDFSIHI